MRVPIIVINLHEADALLDHLPSKQGGMRKAARLFRFIAVELIGGFRLFGKISQVRHAGLHPESHLELLDAGVRFRVADDFVIHLVQRAQAVESFAADSAINTRRVVNEKNWITTAAEGDAGVNAGQKSRRPEARGNSLELIGVRRLRDEDDKGG